MVAEDLAKPAQVQNSGTDGAEPGPPSAPVVKAATAIESIHFIFPAPQSVSPELRDVAPSAEPNPGV